MKYGKKIYKDCDGKKIWKCIQCDYLHLPTSHLYVPHCIKRDKYGYIFRGNEKKKVLEECPLENYKGDNKVAKNKNQSKRRITI